VALGIFAGVFLLGGLSRTERALNLFLAARGWASITGLTPFKWRSAAVLSRSSNKCEGPSEYNRASSQSKRIATAGPAAAEDSRAPKALRVLAPAVAIWFEYVP
jgi:hypothetical protein